MSKQTRVTFSTSPRVKELLEAYAGSRDRSLSWMIKYFLAQGMLVEALRECGAQIMVVSPNGESRSLTEQNGPQIGRLFNEVEQGGSELVVVWPDGVQEKLPVNQDLS